MIKFLATALVPNGTTEKRLEGWGGACQLSSERLSRQPTPHSWAWGLSGSSHIFRHKQSLLSINKMSRFLMVMGRERKRKRRKKNPDFFFLFIYWKDWCWSWSSNTLATSWEESTHWKRPWCWERLKVGGEGDGRRWGDWMASLIQ